MDSLEVGVSLHDYLQLVPPDRPDYDTAIRRAAYRDRAMTVSAGLIVIGVVDPPSIADLSGPRGPLRRSQSGQIGTARARLLRFLQLGVLEAFDSSTRRQILDLLVYLTHGLEVG